MVAFFCPHMSKKLRFITRDSHASADEFEYYTRGVPIPDVARQLHVTPATIRAWLARKRLIPWWTVELLRLRQMEFMDYMRRFEIRNPRLRVVDSNVVRFPVRPQPAPVPRSMPDEGTREWA